MLTLLLLAVFIGFAVGLAWFLISHDRGEKEPVGALWMAVSLGTAAAFVAAFLEKLLISPGNLVSGTAHLPLIGATLSVGVIEEVCKFVPLALVIYKRRYFNEHTDGVIYFALAGLGFGLPENILYTIQFGAKSGLIRVFLTPVFHAAITGMIGYFLAKRKILGHSVWTVVIMLSGAILLHGVYDFGLLSGTNAFAALSLIITLGLSGGLFVLFLRATELDQDKGLSMVGHNSFCRTCGLPNPHHHLYCIHCGKNA